MANTSKATQNLGYCIKEWCSNAPKNIALETMVGNELKATTYAQLYADVMTWADCFRRRGIKQGDRIAMISPKTTKHFQFFFSCFHTGTVGVPICESLGDKEMSFVIGDAAPVLILADKSMMKKAEANAGSVPVVCLDDMPCDTPLDTPRTEPSNADVDDPCVLIYTSGSTGMPKGVMLTHRNVYTNAYWALDCFDFDHRDKIISLLPYWHSYALVCEILCTPMVNATCAVPRDIRDFSTHLSVYKPTVMIAVPRILEMVKMKIDKAIASAPARKKALIEKAIYNASRIFTAGARLDGGILRMFTHHLFYDPLVFRQFRKAFGGKLRFVVVGGAPVDLELQIFFKFMSVPVMVGYGLTETSPVVCANIPDEHKLGTCGKVLKWLLPENGGDYTFKNEEGEMGKNIHGLLMVKGDCVMKGYWNHTDESAKTKEDGWLNTGDMGFADSDGFINIQGRQGNMIVLIGGEKLHPEHIEDAVKLSQYITEAMVIGEKCKNVYVCVNVNADLTKGMSEDEIHAKVKEEVQNLTRHLAAYQKPKDVLVLPQFTMETGTLTATLKIRRFKIKELYRNEIEKFLQNNGEEIATKHELGIAASKVLASMDKGEAVVGNGNIVK